MDTSFYKKEAESLQNLYEKFNEIQFTSDPQTNINTKTTTASTPTQKDFEVLPKGLAIVALVSVVLIVGMVVFLTLWLVK